MHQDDKINISGLTSTKTKNLQIHEILVFLEWGFDSIKLHPEAGNLLLQREHARRNEPSHTERLALFLGEAGAAVLERVLDHSQSRHGWGLLAKTRLYTPTLV